MIRGGLVIVAVVDGVDGDTIIISVGGGDDVVCIDCSSCRSGGIHGTATVVVVVIGILVLIGIILKHIRIISKKMTQLGMIVLCSCINWNDE